MEKEMYQSMYDTETYHWYFKSKYEIVLSILEELGLQKGSQSQLVDFGCGCGVMLKYLSEYGEVSGFDFSEEALKFCRMNFSGRLEQVDLVEYNEKDRYDYGVALDVIEHIEEEQKALENIYQSMKQGGVCIFTVPAYMSLWTNHDKNCMHKRRYNKGQLKRAVSEAGFRIQYCSYYNFWFFPIVFVIRKIQRIFKVNDSGSKLEYGFKEGLLNTLLWKIFSSEKKRICKGKAFPCGVSLICIAKKENTFY